MYNFTARELLVPVFWRASGCMTAPRLPEIQAYCRQQVDTLWDEVKRFDYPHKYVVDLSGQAVGYPAGASAFVQILR